MATQLTNDTNLATIINMEILKYCERLATGCRCC